ncbi:hypothetical protein AAHK20_10605 [Trinickia sp. YCB016]
MAFSIPAYDATDSKLEIAMRLLLIFVGMCPLALIVLIAFARRVDPLSGRLRKRSAARRSDARRSDARLGNAFSEKASRPVVAPSWPLDMSEEAYATDEAGAGFSQRAGR